MTAKLVAIGVSGLLLTAACTGGGDGRLSSAAPPTVVCGRTLNSTPMGAVIEDATRNHRTIDGVSSRGLIFIRVSEGCDSGAEVSWVPATAATLVDKALARDGHPVAVVLRPSTARAAFSVSATRSGKRVGYTTVRLR